MSDEDKYVLTIDQIPKHTAPYKCTFKDCQNKVDGFCSLCGEQEDPTDLYGNPGYSVIKTATNPVYKIHIGDTLTDAARYHWLRDKVIEVLCEGRTSDCYSKWMLPRLMAEDNHGTRYTFDEIIDIQMKRSGE